MKLRALAPGKVNLCLFLGSLRDDGRHRLVTLLESVSLADELELRTGAGLEDEVESAGVDGPNIVSKALEGLRSRGWDSPRVRVEIHKSIPVAAGMGGGSADAAALLRLAQLLAPLPERVIAELAAELGADVPGQLAPGLALGLGAGEEVEPLPPLDSHSVLILPSAHRLATADVYAEADRLGLPRDEGELQSKRRELEAELTGGSRVAPALLVNDLEPAALSLCPDIEPALDAARKAGADQALVSGSGPTVTGLYWGPDAPARASAAAAALKGRFPGAAATVPVQADFGAAAFG